jgi:predicted SAM-dependent methyltransferase
MHNNISLLWELYKRNKVIKNYLASYPIRKLEIGSGPTIHDGWLTTDNRPGASSMYLDVPKRFPFENDLFHYVYSEHMIEHINWQEGLFILKECHCVL